MVVKFYTGTDQNYSIQSSGKLAFSSTDLLITTSSGATITSIPLNIIRKIVFASSQAPTSVVQTQGTTSSLRIFPSPASAAFSFQGGSAGVNLVKAFSLAGQRLISGAYSAGERVPIANLSPGMYIVSVDSKVFKLVKY